MKFGCPYLFCQFRSPLISLSVIYGIIRLPCTCNNSLYFGRNINECLNQTSSSAVEINNNDDNSGLPNDFCNPYRDLSSLITYAAITSYIHAHT